MTRRAALAGMGATLAGAALPTSARPAGAFTPGALWPDDRGVHINAHGGGMLRHGDRWYWFGEHKTPGTGGNVAEVGVHVYSSRDLYMWRDEGIALAVSNDPASPIVRGCIIERPKVVRDPVSGRFVMWFHLERKGQGYAAAHAGVAVADRITGPYRFVRAGRVNPGRWPVNVTAQDRALTDSYLVKDMPGGQMARDMTIFVDAEGTGWHVYSSEENRTLQVARLTPDMAAHDGRYWRVLPGGANEAPAIFRARGRYYMITSGLTGWAPNPARSFVADRIEGPWEPLGNPVRGTAQQVATTFGAQSTFVLPLSSRGGRERFVFMADIWRPDNAIDGRYVWLPIEWEGDRPVLRWRDCWSLHAA
ncbi:beta-glucanase [Sphingomonas sp. Leaf17]|nr:beta-glucanase [Sphingomonas sp. Leaf17]